MQFLAEVLFQAIGEALAELFGALFGRRKKAVTQRPGQSRRKKR